MENYSWELAEGFVTSFAVVVFVAVVGIFVAVVVTVVVEMGSKGTRHSWICVVTVR